MNPATNAFEYNRRQFMRLMPLYKSANSFEHMNKFLKGSGFKAKYELDETEYLKHGTKPPLIRKHRIMLKPVRKIK